MAPRTYQLAPGFTGRGRGDLRTVRGGRAKGQGPLAKMVFFMHSASDAAVAVANPDPPQSVLPAGLVLGLRLFLLSLVSPLRHSDEWMRRSPLPRIARDLNIRLGTSSGARGTESRPNPDSVAIPAELKAAPPQTLAPSSRPRS